MLIEKNFTFEASHILPRHPGRCSRLHGHSWKLAVIVEGQINPTTGMVVDFGDLSEVVHTYVVDKLDHQHLGYGPANTFTAGPNSVTKAWHPPFGLTFYPTSENLARAIGKMLQPLVRELGPGISLMAVRVNETCTSSATWRAQDES